MATLYNFLWLCHIGVCCLRNQNLLLPFSLIRYGLFIQTSASDRLLIPNASAKYLENGIQMIEFLGRVVGKALYEGILLDYSFSHVFVQKLLGRYSFLDELSTLDPELYRNLMYVKVSIVIFTVQVWKRNYDTLWKNIASLPYKNKWKQLKCK